jgi:Fe-S cluster assembly protein SufD
MLEVTNSVVEQAPDWDALALPDWYLDLQRKAWDDFLSLPMPKRGDEPWRFANLKKQVLGRFEAAQQIDAELAKNIQSRSALLETVAGKFVFANEQLLTADRPSAEGLLCLPLREAIETHGPLFQEHFMTQEAPLGSDKFAKLHKSRAVSGLFVYVPAGVEVELPIEAYHWVAGMNQSMLPHTLIVTGENAKVTVVDHFKSAATDQAGFCCGVVDLVAGRGSKIRYVSCQTLSDDSSNIQLSTTLASADADVKSLQVQLGSQWSRTESVSHMAGKGANSDMLSVAVPSAEQEIDQRTLQHHADPNTKSDLLYKNALFGKGRSIFAGLIKVDEGAHHTDSYQTCRNLFLSDDADANAMPGLEIDADQVKCSHGSTSSPITEEELFYFNARGIPSNMAKQLITSGFTGEVIAKLGDEAVELMVGALVEAKFRKTYG